MQKQLGHLPSPNGNIEPPLWADTPMGYHKSLIEL